MKTFPDPAGLPLPGPGDSLVVLARVAELAAWPGFGFALPEAEEARIARLLKAEDRAVRRAAWQLARLLLGAALGCAPAAVPVTRALNGRPQLDGAGAAQLDLDFNLAHCSGAVAVGVARGGRIGVDVEDPRPLDVWTDIARDMFDPADHASWRAVPKEARAAAALAVWCGKEAVLKATGEGLAGDPRTVKLVPSGAPSAVQRGERRLLLAAGPALAPTGFACAVESDRPPAIFVLAPDGWRTAGL
ncbi:4'-phosphopantetheinyl transferase family protein [Xanthobacter oligotrophicus]|uniref:4'-phosphopantetheinyl transferase family protein n=1 Tax=Xanthobacter oligotrophicus TaxID=2607286 RepID=UPI00165DAFC1|nr:4'-phosphopantetheinyl transferase superfamily protein [Xanthobacter oligotrophicus]MCG5234565.1 4'-phosphopantetheinyl transferase superfamily protein [Xanthobacter oligotrophicus]